jgi:hypothetical protein
MAASMAGSAAKDAVARHIRTPALIRILLAVFMDNSG